MPTLEWRCVNTPNDAVSDTIDFVSRGVVCHTEFVFGNQSYGARSDGGVKYRPLDVYPVDYRFTANATDEQYAAFMTFLNAQNGKPYNFKGILGVLTDSDWTDQKAWYCSQLWAAAMQAGNVIGQLPKAITNFTPEDALLVSAAKFTGGLLASA